MFTKRAKKVRNMVKEAINNHEYKKAVELGEAEFEGWKQGFKSGMTASIGGIVLGTVGAIIVNKIIS